MDHPLIDLITARIREAEARGEFDNLPGAGKPLPHVDNPENAVIDRIIRDAGAVPEYVSLARELSRLRAELAETGDRAARKALMQKIADLEPRAALARDAWRR